MSSLVIPPAVELQREGRDAPWIHPKRIYLALQPFEGVPENKVAPLSTFAFAVLEVR